MRNVGKERLLLGAELFVAGACSFKSLGEDVHGTGKRANLISAVDLRAGFVLAAGERERNLLQRGDRPCEHTGEEQCKQYGERKRNPEADQENCGAGNLCEALLTQRRFKEHDAENPALLVHDGHTGCQMNVIAVRILEEGRFAHEAQRDALLQIGGQKRIFNALHDAAEVTRDVMIGIDNEYVAVGQLLDEGQIRRERVFADDKARFIQPFVAGGGDPLRKGLRDGVGVALHRLAIVIDRLAAHQGIVEDADEEREGDEQKGEEQHEPCCDGTAWTHESVHGSILSNL